ncbi:unnamed protein product [Closterium sp. NIES-54]
MTSLSTSRPPPPSRLAPLGVSHVTPQPSPLQHPVPVVFGGVGGAAAKGVGTGAAGFRGAGSGGAGGVRVETTPEEDTAVSTQRLRPASPPGFPSFPQFPPCSPLRPVAAEPGDVRLGGIGVLRGVVVGGSCSRGAGAGDTGTASPTPRIVRFLTRVQRLDKMEREERERFERAQQQQQQSKSDRQERVEEESRPPQQVQLVEESRPQQQERVEELRFQQQVQLQPHQERVEEESRPQLQLQLQPLQERVEEEPHLEQEEQQQGQAVPQHPLEEAGQQRLRDLPDPAPARLVRGPLPSPPIPLVEFLASSPWTRRSPLGRAVSLEPHWSPLVTTVAGFASSHRHDYASHLLSGTARFPSTGGVPVFPLEVLEDRQFELGFQAAAVPHLCAMLLAPEGDADALDIPIPRTHAEAFS